MKPGFWVGIDEKFLVREVRAQSEVERLDSTKRVIEHFDQAKRGYELTKIRAQVHDIAELKKILKRPITLLDITHDKYEEIEIVVHNGHAFSRNQYFSRDRIVEYYKGDTWEAINNALQGPQAIWLMGVGDETQRISQFVLEDSRTFRTWKKHIEIIEACKQLVNDAINWQYQENIINKEKKSILLESLKVVDLAEQFNRFGHPIHHLVRVAVNGKLPKDDITGFAQIRSFKFAPNIHLVILVWYGKHFACREDLTVGEQTKVWLPNNRDISCAIIDKDELDFLIKDCTDAGTFAEALYKIENVPAFFKQEKAKDSDLCPHTYSLCAMCTDSEEFFISKSEYTK
ncbi:45370_t:CDS:2 [Gigaspora margarita]|uniref:45370_t:CDS:1 n=1 Tax=Gigaspora margarita TaxID=4874 RepID=A0ABN7V441_GIGMA|nr:45370_t:CDS:2 [Gigaspora margarita]